MSEMGWKIYNLLSSTPGVRFYHYIYTIERCEKRGVPLAEDLRRTCGELAEDLRRTCGALKPLGNPLDTL